MTPSLHSSAAFILFNFRAMQFNLWLCPCTAGKQKNLCGRRKAYAKHPPFFHNYSCYLSKGQTVHKRFKSNSFLSNWHLPLYFSNYAISTWYIFIWHAHKRIPFLCRNKNAFCVTQTFCWLKSTLIERKLSQSDLWESETFVVLASITNFYPVASQINK